MRATTTVILPMPRRVNDFARAFDTGPVNGCPVWRKLRAVAECRFMAAQRRMASCLRSTLQRHLDRSLADGQECASGHALTAAARCDRRNSKNRKPRKRPSVSNSMPPPPPEPPPTLGAPLYTTRFTADPGATFARPLGFRKSHHWRRPCCSTAASPYPPARRQ